MGPTDGIGNSDSLAIARRYREDPREAPSASPKSNPATQDDFVQKLPWASTSTGLADSAFTNPALTGRQPAAMHPAMIPLAVRDGGTANERLKARERAHLDELRAELAKLGDTTPCRDDDTVDVLTRRLQGLTAAALMKREAAISSRLNIGADGRLGTAEQLDAYNVQQWIIAANPGSGTGAWAAGMAAALGGSLDDVRAAGQAGNTLEGVAGGAGRVLTRGDVPANSAKARGSRPPGRGPGTAPRQRATTPAAAARIVPDGGLGAHEARGGHTLSKHVGKTEAELVTRLVAEKLTASSSFADRATAEAVVAGALEANDAAIKSWIAAGASGRLVLKYDAAPTVIGVTVPGGATIATSTTTALVILKPDSSAPSKFYVRTAFPTL